MVLKHGKRCMKCGYTGYIEMHHIIPVSEGGDHIESNVLLLCEKCHMDEQGWEKKNYIDESRKHWNGF